MAWTQALATLFAQDNLDPALLAALLTPPGEAELAEREKQVDPGQIHTLRQQLERQLAERLGSDALVDRYHALHSSAPVSLKAGHQAARRLKRRVLQLLALIDADAAHAMAQAQYEKADGMTDRLAALQLLVHDQAPQAAAALEDFRRRHAHTPLALDKWFAVQAQWPAAEALERVLELEEDPAFTLKNPNRARSLLSAFATANPIGFHRPDGAGYRLLAERLRTLDALNPQIAARLAKAFDGWHRLEPVRREAAQAAIQSLAATPMLSRNLSEIISSMLED